MRDVSNILNLTSDLLPSLHSQMRGMNMVLIAYPRNPYFQCYMHVNNAEKKLS